MERHGSETYFVIGEGLLGESVGGRDRTLAVAVETVTPPFRFSRMGPSGLNRQLGEANRKKVAQRMCAGASRGSQIHFGAVDSLDVDAVLEHFAEDATRSEMFPLRLETTADGTAAPSMAAEDD